MSSGLLKDLVYGWLFGFIVPKSIIYPVFRGMWRAMKATDRLDEQDRQAAADGDGGPLVRARPRRHRPPRGGSPRIARRDRVRR